VDARPDAQQGLDRELNVFLRAARQRLIADADIVNRQEGDATPSTDLRDGPSLMRCYSPADDRPAIPRFGQCLNATFEKLRHEEFLRDRNQPFDPGEPRPPRFLSAIREEHFLEES